MGFSNDPKMRLDALQASSPENLRLAFAIWFETNSIAFQVEQATHRRLALKKRHGEWFDVEPDEAIDAVAHCIADKKVPYAAHADMLEFKAALWSRYRAEHEARDKKMTNWVKAKPDKVWRDPDFVYYRRDGETVIEGV